MSLYLKKGRPMGQKHYRAKLSDAEVQAMRSEYLAYVRGYEYLAKQYGCGISTARDIITYRVRAI